MSDLYLIAHRVRGKPAFDVAQRMACVLCQTYTSAAGTVCKPTISQDECAECEGEGHWWIIPTSGHRAYPYWWITFDDLAKGFIWEDIEAPSTDWPDHYAINERPSERESFVLRPALSDLLGIGKPPVDFKRRV